MLNFISRHRVGLIAYGIIGVLVLLHILSLTSLITFPLFYLMGWYVVELFSQKKRTGITNEMQETSEIQGDQETKS